jgi:orotate phosphoribosyltransferase
MEKEASLEVAINNENTRRLREIATEVGAFLRGEFTLTSGKKSNYYFDGKKVNLSPEGIYRVGKAIFDQLVGLKVDAVGGVPVGAYPVVAAVALVSHLEGKPIPAFIVREEVKEHGTKSRIEGHFKAGYRVAMLDDVCTTGGSVLKAIKAVEAAGGKVVKVMVLVDRLEGGSDLLKAEGYDFQALLKITHE